MTDELLALAREIMDLQRRLFTALMLSPEQRRGAGSLAEEHLEARRRLRLLVHDGSVIALPDPAHAQERAILQQAMTGDLPLDRLLSGDSGRLDLEFTQDELEPLAEEYLSWFSQYDYAQARLNEAVLVLKAGALPYVVSHFVEEIVECFAFQRYTAVVSLCRTALEVALRPAYIANGLADPDSENSEYVRQRVWRTGSPEWKKRRMTDEGRLYVEDFSPDIDQLITRPCWLPPYAEAKVDEVPLRDRLHDLRRRGNSYVHAQSAANADAARNTMRDLFRALHALYEAGPPTA